MSGGIGVTIAVGDYDQTRDLLTGAVAREGVQYVAVPRPEDLFERVLRGGEFAGAEMSLAIATALRARGDSRFVVVPVFPARAFRHSAIYTPTTGVKTPAELAGRRVGIPVWAQTAGIYVRGFLGERYGLDLTSVEWVRAGVDAPGRREPVEFDPRGHSIGSAPQHTLDELLLEREVDAVISARPPASVERGDPRVRRMFAAPEAEERSYFEETGVFPIMHVLVVRRHAIESTPGLVDGLVADFTEAKDRALARALSATAPSYPLPWASTSARGARRLFGDDFWPYGVERNAPTLDAFLTYAHQQGLTERRMTTSELFAVPASS